MDKTRRIRDNTGDQFEKNNCSGRRRRRHDGGHLCGEDGKGIGLPG